MKFSFTTLGQHIGSIILAIIVWWAVTVLVGLVLFQIWPPELIPVSGDENTGRFSIMLGVSLGRNWQNVPANVLGFVSALYAFRALCPTYRQAGQQENL